MLQREEVEEVFRNIESIRDCSRAFLGRLAALATDHLSLADVYLQAIEDVRHAPRESHCSDRLSAHMSQKLFNDVYREYINGQSVAMRLVREKYKSNAEFGKFLDEVRSPLALVQQQRHANNGRSAKRILDVAMRVSPPFCTCQFSAFHGTVCSSGYGSIQHSQVRHFSEHALILLSS